MNYFAHGYRFLEDPYFLAGTAVPDWLSVSDRAARVRRVRAEACCRDGALDEANHVSSAEAVPPALRRIAAGVLQHMDDDRRFHDSPAFFAVASYVAQTVRSCVRDVDGARPGFVGHLLTELLLDASLIERAPALLDGYYRILETVDSDAVQQCVNLMTRAPSGRLAAFIRAFRTEQFLRCYLDDHRLLYRVNQVLRRVRLPALPDTVAECLPDVRQFVSARCDALLSPVLQEQGALS